MPYSNLVREYSRKNHFKYNHRALFRQVRAAMRGPIENRENALKEILERNFVADAVKYEPKRRELIYNAGGMGANDNDDLLNDINRMADPPRFLEEYANIINAMATDIDNTYEPKFMLGLDAENAKALVDRQLGCYSRLDESKYGLYNDGWDEALRRVEESRFSRIRNQVRNYATSDENLQGAMKETYIRMKIVQARLNSKIFLWKWFFRAETRAMENFIATAQNALNDVNFPDSAKAEADEEFTRTSALQDAYDQSHQIIDARYRAQAPQMEQSEQIEQENSSIDNENKVVANNNEEEVRVHVDVIDESNDAHNEVSQPQEHEQPLINEIQNNVV